MSLTQTTVFNHWAVVEHESELNSLIEKRTVCHWHESVSKSRAKLQSEIFHSKNQQRDQSLPCRRCASVKKHHCSQNLGNRNFGK